MRVSSLDFKSPEIRSSTMRLLIAFLLVVLSGLGNSAIGQQAGNSAVVSTDRTDASAYRVLFRRVLLYKKLADEADAAHAPKPQLRRIVSNRFGFNDADGASLERLSLAYQGEINPLHAQITEVIAKLYARFPSGIAQKDSDTTPPPELAQLHQQEDAVTLRYRDLLRNSMREEDFQKVQAKVRDTFGKPIAH
jgi:hypothetical protein